MITKTSDTLMCILRQNACLYPEKPALMFLSETKKGCLMNQALLQETIGIAARLVVVVQPGAFAYQYLQPEQIAELNLPISDVSFDFQNLEFRPIIDLYDRETICHLTKQFLQIIKEVIANPERTYGNLADALGAKL